MAGIQSMSSDSYDEAICLPTEEAVRVALKYQNEIEAKKRIIVGVNEYVEEEDVPVSPFEFNPNKPVL